MPYRRSAFECLDSQYDDCRGCYGSLRTWAAFAAHYLGAERLVLCAMAARAGLSTIACLVPSCGLSRAIRPPAHRKAMAAKVPSLCFRLTVSRMSSEAHRSCRQRTTPPDPASFPFRSFLLPLSRALDIYIYIWRRYNTHARVLVRLKRAVLMYTHL